MGLCAIPDDVAQCGWTSGIRSVSYFASNFTHFYAIGQDILPLPVNREKCKFHRDSETSVEKEPDFIPVEWKLSFSGRTPAKHAIANYLQPWTVGMNHTESEYEMQKKHGYDELISASSYCSLWLFDSNIFAVDGALGHRFNQEAHPRRMLLLDVTA